MRLVTGLIQPTRGSILIDGFDLAGLDKSQMYRLRQQIGVVPADGGLVSNLKMWENITLPLMYQTGGVSAEAEQNALDYLASLGYSGDIMAMPAHLTHHEKRLASIVRMFLRQPRIMLYINCMESGHPAARETFIRVTTGFHTADKDRISLYLTSSPDLAGDFPVDMVVRTHESVESASRSK
ncbi:MAG: ATP-binding cassette domain-containing protein [Geobacteraceae bacterium]|nr:ATP-binding cassette domain-containing protein [Geobacteraceae bacterium]